MSIRELKLEDAEKMLEWMHSPDVVKWLGANFASKTIEDCKKFIHQSKDETQNVNYAITDETDEYLGTVSLKNINAELKVAEFAIVLREKAMGTGISANAMHEMIEYGLKNRALYVIYWCVNCRNTRAIRFYDKQGYQRTEDVPSEIKDAYTEAQQKEMLWYFVSK